MVTQELAGRAALVTGSTSGIGEAVALELAARGAHVVVTGRRQELGDGVVARIRQADGKADFVTAALGSAASARDLAGAALEVTGGRLDILVNNAGTGVLAATAHTREQDWDDLIDSNVKGHFFLVGVLGPLMAERGKGWIVNTTSTAAQQGTPVMAAYGAAKAALAVLTKTWAVEFGPSGVRVNAVSPGITRTEALVEAMGGAALDQTGAQSPLGYAATTQEIANVVAFLVSDQASYVNGAVVAADGGATAN